MATKLRRLADTINIQLQHRSRKMECGERPTKARWLLALDRKYFRLRYRQLPMQLEI
jgi:hypothetical protein